MRTLAATAGILLLLLGAGCGKRKARAPVAATRPSAGSSSGRGSSGRQTPPPASLALGYTETGLASWYGKPYHGRPAADGEIYDMETLVAAHRTLPFQTWVRVTMLATNKSVDVRIIDRGPFVDGRIIDLSHRAAIDLGLIEPGVGQVRMEVIRAPERSEPQLFSVQVGVFRDEANADRYVLRMSDSYGPARKVLRPGNPVTWRVLAGSASSQDDAEALAVRIRAEQNVPEAFVVRLDP